jgi:pimeloyl-ACP methyl ester carboxylesterase
MSHRKEFKMAKVRIVKRRPMKKIVLVAAIILLGAPTLFTLWLLTWDGGVAVGKQRVLLPGVQLNLQTVTTALGLVEYDLYGTKGPVVLSLHGGLGGADQGRLFASWLQGDGFRILSPSRPGYLGTPLASGKTLEAQADLFAALLDTLHIEKVGVLSTSAGGPVAYTFAARYPERVWGLVSIDGVSRHDPEKSSSSVMQTAFMNSIGQKLVMLTADISLQSMVSGTLDETSHFTSEQKAQRIAYIMNTPKVRTFFKAMLATTFPYSERTAGTDNDAAQARTMQPLPFARVKAPSFILHGTLDGDVPFDDSVYASEHIPNAQHYWMMNGDHLGFWLGPDATKAQDVARTFLQQHALGG